MTRSLLARASIRSARAKASRGWAEIRIGFEDLVADLAAANSPAMMAAAAERNAVSRCCVSSTKTRLSLFADCRLATAVTVIEPLPIKRQPSFSARLRRLCFMAVYCRFSKGEYTTPGNWSCGDGALPRLSGAEPRHHTRLRSISTEAIRRVALSSSGDAPRATDQDNAG